MPSKPASLLLRLAPLALTLVAGTIQAGIPEVDEAPASSARSPYGEVQIREPPPTPRPLPVPSDGAARARGAAWLERVQHSDGGWGSGAWGDNRLEVPSDAATTSVAVLALLRDAAGSGRHSAAITAGVHFLVRAVETAPRGEARLNTPTGTQPQYKLGPLVDTHLTALALGEVSGRLDGETNRRVLAALDTVVGKVQRAQQANGAFEAGGWAPVLSSSVAAMGLMRAQDAGVAVDQAVLARADAYQAANVNYGGGTFEASDGAGVELYAVAGAMRTSTAAKAQGRGGMAPAAEATTRRLDANTDALVNGFGSVGGEEMLSYMMISDALAEAGGRRWTDWEGRMGGYLAGIQNADGSWAGHHCITSATFVTAVAVMTLAAGDHARGGRAPVGSWQPAPSGSWGSASGPWGSAEPGSWQPTAD